jgi:hypothetical protein
MNFTVVVVFPTPRTVGGALKIGENVKAEDEWRGNQRFQKIHIDSEL